MLFAIYKFGKLIYCYLNKVFKLVALFLVGQTIPSQYLLSEMANARVVVLCRLVTQFTGWWTTVVRDDDEVNVFSLFVCGTVTTDTLC